MPYFLPSNLYSFVDWTNVLTGAAKDTMFLIQGNLPTLQTESIRRADLGAGITSLRAILW